MARATQPDHNDLWEKFADARREMQASLIERDDEIDVVLTALVAQEHPLLVGPPGTGKSMLLDSLIRLTGGTQEFNILFTKFTTPEEVFGPISVQGLKQDVYRRVTTGKLPEAQFAFLDEVFKASSAILNTMLRILNERVYEDGTGQFVKCPLLIALAASNEWPGDGDGGKELGALFDRFLFRKKVQPIRSRTGRHRLLFGAADHTPKFSGTISPAEVQQAHQVARTLPWSKEAQEAMMAILDKLNEEGIFPGDRRIFKSRMAARARAFLDGAMEVRPESLDVLAHTLWDDPAEQPEKCSRIVGKIANPTGTAVNDKLVEMEDVMAKCNPTEAVSKLQAIQRELKAMPAHPRRDAAVKLAQQNIKLMYAKVIEVELDV